MPPIPPPGLDPFGPQAIPEPLTTPEAYDGLVTRRILAYLIDLLILAMLALLVWLILGAAGLLTFGLLLPLQPLALALLPFAYHILLIAGEGSATLGMRLMGLRVYSIVDGGRPHLLQAALNVFIFYGSLALTGSLILLVALFNSRGRTLHDYLAGTIVLRQRRDAAY
jgi:uncharacterized RDD family membrane protein YckC